MTDFDFLHRNGRMLTFRYELYSKEGAFKKTLTGVVSAVVTYNSLSALKRSAKITMEDDPAVDYVNDRIRVLCDVMACGETRTYPLGTFLISAPARANEDGTATREMECYSKLQVLLDDKIETRYVVRRGTNVVNEVIRLVSVSGEHHITPSALTLAADREWEMGTDKLTIANDLLAVINYTSLRVDAADAFEATPYILSADRPVEFAYLEGKGSVLGRTISDDLDFFNAPNVFVRYTDNPDADALRSVYVNDNPLSPTSTVCHGRRITSCEKVDDVADQATLDAITRRDAISAAQIYSHVEFATAIMPLHGYMNTVRLHCGAIDGIYEETEWEITCDAGAEMTHKARKVVEV